jgi:hypothetical protein
MNPARMPTSVRYSDALGPDCRGGAEGEQEGAVVYSMWGREEVCAGLQVGQGVSAAAQPGLLNCCCC